MTTTTKTIDAPTRAPEREWIVSHIFCVACNGNRSRPGGRAICGAILKHGTLSGDPHRATCVVCQDLKYNKPCCGISMRA